MQKWILSKDGKVENILVAEEAFLIEHYADYDRALAEGNEVLPIPENWIALEEGLRDSPSWVRCFTAASMDVAANAAFTVIYGTITTTHNLNDLKFSLLSMRTALISLPIGDFTQGELDYIRSVLSSAGFDPTLIDIPIP